MWVKYVKLFLAKEKWETGELMNFFFGQLFGARQEVVNSPLFDLGRDTRVLEKLERFITRSYVLG